MSPLSLLILLKWDFSQQNLSHLLTLSIFLVTILAGSIYQLYRFALPSPLPGIPYNALAARSLRGDRSLVRDHIISTDGTLITYMQQTMEKLNAPMVQLFIAPLGKPQIVLGDFREAQDILLRRKDFDRSSSTSDLARGLAPNHHITLKTTERWRAQRNLIQDLMKPSYLNNVAGPLIHRNACVMVDLWRAKSRIAAGRPWHAARDINRAALDAVMGFCFGVGFEHSAIRPALDAVNNMDVAAVERMRSKDLDHPIEFPVGQIDETLQATYDLSALVGTAGNLLPSLYWAHIMRKPNNKKAQEKKEAYIMEALADAVSRLTQSDCEDEVAKSAVDHLIVREKFLAQKEGRRPDYFSRNMIDEIFGFIFAGHETTSTTIGWAPKYLADNPGAQGSLRKALQHAYPAARHEGRNPTIQEIVGTSVPFLDATVEELLRCAGTVPIVDRQAVVDTEILGHRIPKGTIVSCLVTGPSVRSPAFDIEERLRHPSSQAAKLAGQSRAWNPEDISLFKPERWLSIREEWTEYDAASGPQLAFGMGIRGCYGKRLAYLELRTLLVLIIWNFELLPCPPSLSSYRANLVNSHEARDCFVRLREVNQN